MYSVLFCNRQGTVVLSSDLRIPELDVAKSMAALMCLVTPDILQAAHAEVCVILSDDSAVHALAELVWDGGSVRPLDVPIPDGMCGKVVEIPPSKEMN